MGALAERVEYRVTEKTPKSPANDNRCSRCRKVIVEMPPELPITEHELALIETHFGAMIAEMLNEAANDNEPRAGPDRRSEP